MPTGSAGPSKLAPSSIPPFLAALYETPLLTPEQERHLFRKYNFLKFQARRLRDSLDSERPSIKKMRKTEDYYQGASKVREHIARANLRLVVSLVKDRVSASHGFPELISEGNVALLKAIEKFDYGRGFKFSTYATWAIVNNIRRAVPKERIYSSRFQTGREEPLAARRDHRHDPLTEEVHQGQRQRTVNRLMAHLDDREQTVISNRFGLDYRLEPKTLKEVGELLGVSKERARQLERRAISKLRDIPGKRLRVC